MLIKHTKEIIYVQIDFQNIEFQYLLLQNLGVVIQLKLSYHFASNSFIVLILGSLSVFISVVSEHHDNLVRTENFSFWINLLLQKCLFIKATQAYFLYVSIVLCQEVIWPSEYRIAPLQHTRLLAFEVRDTALPRLDPV